MSEREDHILSLADVYALAMYIAGSDGVLLDAANKSSRRELQAALADRPEPAQPQIRHVNGLYPPNTSIRLQVLGCYATAEHTDIDVQLPCAPQEPAQPVAQLQDGYEMAVRRQEDPVAYRWPEYDKNGAMLRWKYGGVKPAFDSEPLYAAPPSHHAPSETLVPECIKETGCEHAVACNATQRCALARLSVPSEAGAEQQERIRE